MTIAWDAPENGGIRTQSQSQPQSRGPQAPGPGSPSAGTGRLILLWYAGLALAALFLHWAMASTASVLMASALASAAVVLPLTLLGYTMKSYGGAYNSHLLVPAIGPIVIAVLILEYVEYNKRVDEAYSADLIPSSLLILSDVKLSRDKGRGRISGHIVNRSPHQLTGVSLELMLFGGSEKLTGAAAEAKLDVGPGQQANFAVAASEFGRLGVDQLPCIRQEQLPPPAMPAKPGVFECYFQVTGTRGEEVGF